MSDQYQDMASGLTAPASGAYSVTPSDSAALSIVPRALYIGIGGSLSVEMKWGGIVTFQNLPDGALIPIRAVKVLAASTASAIVGLY
ncbi:spike base protein, RCAP_Rcc01079 family [Devosia faecipullorum]|uniref:spike base protein, RCAP_Rcc01079 family n=1 Tax=Devosia faecipullorum TaxID=2755039 RepID=UPI00187BB85F|nr:hypothetical protein [Devosia faecipullorum]MBE7731993.1 hypothetical protein [Devosia faecipullorum]